MPEPMSLERAAMVAIARQGAYCSTLRDTADFLASIGHRQYGDIRDRREAQRLSALVDEMAERTAEGFADRAVEQEAMRQAIALHPNADAMRDILKGALKNA